MLKKKLIAKIHVLKKNAGLDDATYRLKLEMLTGKDSCKNMSLKDLEKIIASFTAAGLNNKPYYKPTTTKSKFKFVDTKCSKMKKIFKLWQELAEINSLKDTSNKGLNNFLFARFGCEYEGINNKNTVNNNIKDKIIEALKTGAKENLKKLLIKRLVYIIQKLCIYKDKILLSKSEAEYLMQLIKTPKESRKYFLPVSGNIEINLITKDSKDEFIFNINKSRIVLNKITYQNRTKGSNFILSRLDLNGGPHSNPDGEKIDCPHIH